MTIAGTTTSGLGAHAEGHSTQAQGDQSHAEGPNTIASGTSSHAEGESSTSTGSASHAEGYKTTASGDSSHAEGTGTIASAPYSHAEGADTTASNFDSHAEGGGTTASGDSSHAEGSFTTASGDFYHAEGFDTTADETYSHAEGLVTSTNGHVGAHIMGKYGNADSDFSWHLTNGTVPTPGLAARIDGTVAQGIATHGWVTGPADYAEMFETVDGNPIDVGYFVTLDLVGDKIRKANVQDSYVLGITSATPAFLGGAHELEWKNKWVKDEWGRWVFHEVTVPPITNIKGDVFVPERTEMQKIVHPEYDSKKEYIPRIKRPEWVSAELLGQLLVRDDGTCKPGGYCKPNHDGIASEEEIGYRVMRRTGPNQVLIFV